MRSLLISLISAGLGVMPGSSASGQAPKSSDASPRQAGVTINTGNCAVIQIDGTNNAAKGGDCAPLSIQPSFENLQERVFWLAEDMTNDLALHGIGTVTKISGTRRLASLGSSGLAWDSFQFQFLQRLRDIKKELEDKNFKDDDLDQLMRGMKTQREVVEDALRAPGLGAVKPYYLISLVATRLLVLGQQINSDVPARITYDAEPQSAESVSVTIKSSKSLPSPARFVITCTSSIEKIDFVSLSGVMYPITEAHDINGAVGRIKVDFPFITPSRRLSFYLYGRIPIRCNVQLQEQ